MDKNKNKDKSKIKNKRGRPVKERPCPEFIQADMLDQLANGVTRTEMQKYAKNKYGFSKATANSYIKKAADHYVKLGKGLQDSVLSTVLMNLREMYIHALKDKKYETCLKINDRMAHLVGVSLSDPSDGKDGSIGKLKNSDISKVTIQTITASLQSKKNSVKFLEGLGESESEDIIEGEFTDDT